MTNGWNRDDEGHLRREMRHRMGRRLTGWDYRRTGHYVITIVLAERSSQALGKLMVRKIPDGVWLPVMQAKEMGLQPEDIEARVEFSELGRAVFEHFQRMGEFTPGVKPVYCAVMPDHLHLLLKVEKTLARPLGNAIGGFKTGCEKIHARTGGAGRLFAEGFVDHVILREGQLAAEFNYLLDNPRRLAIKRLFPELFKVVRRVGIPLRLAPQTQDGRGKAALATSSEIGQNPSSVIGQNPVADGAIVRSAPAAQAVGWFSALGNHFLLQRSLVQVQVSRRDFGYRRSDGRIVRDANGIPEIAFATPEYAARHDMLLAAASQGAVLLSPCVSDGERQIAREALDAGLPLITLQNKGLAPVQKPSGRYFEACSAGRLLMLAPIAWPFQPGEKPMTRGDATALNRISQWLEGDGAAEVNYHGLEPSNVDQLALDAICIRLCG